MKQRALHLAAYDITAADRLCRALEILHDYATGGQKSVFECFLTPGERRELLQRMDETIDHEEDRFFLIPLSRRAKTRTLGSGTRPVEPKYYYLG